MEQFVDDDPGYLDWVARHPDSFVINTGRIPAALPGHHGGHPPTGSTAPWVTTLPVVLAVGSG